jgi:hypothetical protein
VKSWENVPRENLRDLLDRIQLKRQSGAAVPCSTTTTPFFASDWKTSILMVMGCLLLAQQATYSPFIWRAGSALISTLLAGRDNYQQVSATRLAQRRSPLPKLPGTLHDAGTGRDYKNLMPISFQLLH